MDTYKFFWGPKILIPAVRIKIAKFPSAPFFEWTRRKVHKIKKFKKGHKCIPKKVSEAQKF